MKKKDIYKIREIIQEIKNLDDNDRDMMSKDKRKVLYKEAVSLLNEYINKMKPL